MGAGEAIGDDPEIMDVGVPPVSLLSVVAKFLNENVQTNKNGMRGLLDASEAKQKQKKKLK